MFLFWCDNHRQRLLFQCLLFKFWIFDQYVWLIWLRQVTINIVLRMCKIRWFDPDAWWIDLVWHTSSIYPLNLLFLQIELQWLLFQNFLHLIKRFKLIWWILLYLNVIYFHWLWFFKINIFNWRLLYPCLEIRYVWFNSFDFHCFWFLFKNTYFVYLFFLIAHLLFYEKIILRIKNIFKFIFKYKWYIHSWHEFQIY